MEDDNFFMALAFLTAERSKDPLTQVGACIVRDGKVISTGYNGMPWGCSDDLLPWTNMPENEEENKRPYVCHAEYNAFINKGDKDVDGSILYTGLFPCKDCAKLIVQSGVTEVIYMSHKYKNKPKYQIAEDILTKANVKFRQHVPKEKTMALTIESPQTMRNYNYENYGR